MNGCASCRAVSRAGAIDGSPARMVAAALDGTTGTVTELLEHLAGEPIDADIRHQRVAGALDGNQLGLHPHAPLLRRAVLLTGRVSGLAFVYAESEIATDRLPRSACTRLETSRDPIGRVLVDHHLTLHREQLPGPVVAARPGPAAASALDGAVQSRRYRIVADGTPVIIVSEWFLPPVAAALADHLRPAATPDAGG